MYRLYFPTLTVLLTVISALRLSHSIGKNDEYLKN